MIDGTKFSTWKDFAYIISEELDGLQKEDAKNKEELKKLREDYVIFRTKVYTIVGIIGAVIIAMIGIFQITIR
jgi:hypothetical protein